MIAVATPSPAAHADTPLEQRRVIVSLSPTTIEVLIAYELPAGAEAARMRGLIDLDRDGVIDDAYESLAQAQLLLPRVNGGLSLRVGDVQPEFELDDVRFTPGAGEGERQGFVGMALYRASHTLVGETRLTFDVEGGSVAASVEIQGVEGVSIVDAPVAVAPDVELIGPVAVHPDHPLVVTVSPTVQPESVLQDDP